METLKIETQRLIGVTLNTHQLSLLDRYQRELEDWNTRFNLTAIQEPEKVRVKHFLDSFSSYLLIKNTPQKKIIDIGTGAGLPGIPLKILLPGARLVLLESVAKKTAFLKQLVDRLGLEYVEILTGRAEDMAHQANFRERFDLAVSRAVGSLSTIAELALPFCHQEGGIFIAPKKGQIEVEINQARQAIETLGGRLREIKELDLPFCVSRETS